MCGVGVLSGVDIRASNGYVLAPGSTIGTRGYMAYDALLEPIPMPQKLRAVLRRPREMSGNVERKEPSGGWDTPQALAAGRSYLRGRGTAIEGQGGDLWTYQTACGLRDRGVSEEMALQLLIEPCETDGEPEGRSWNDRCDPPWDIDGSQNSLSAKVSNAYRYAENPPGVTLAMFDSLPVESFENHPSRPPNSPVGISPQSIGSGMISY